MPRRRNKTFQYRRWGGNLRLRRSASDGKAARPGSMKQERRRFPIRFRRQIRHPVCGFVRDGLMTGWFDPVSKPKRRPRRTLPGLMTGWFDAVSKLPWRLLFPTRRLMSGWFDTVAELKVVVLCSRQEWLDDRANRLAPCHSSCCGRLSRFALDRLVS